MIFTRPALSENKAATGGESYPHKDFHGLSLKNMLFQRNVILQTLAMVVHVQKTHSFHDSTVASIACAVMFQSPMSSKILEENYPIAIVND